MLEMLGLQNEELVLDLGCGGVYFTERIAKNGVKCCAIDIDKRSLRAVRGKIPAMFICGKCYKHSH